MVHRAAVKVCTLAGNALTRAATACRTYHVSSFKSACIFIVYKIYNIYTHYTYTLFTPNISSLIKRSFQLRSSSPHLEQPHRLWPFLHGQHCFALCSCIPACRKSHICQEMPQLAQRIQQKISKDKRLRAGVRHPSTHT